MAQIKKIPRIQKSSVDDRVYFSPYEQNETIDWEKSSLWKITTEGSRKGFVILRYLKDRSGATLKERLPRSLYEAFKGNEIKCTELINVLNHREETRRRSREEWKIKSEFLKVQGNELSRMFEDFLRDGSNNKKHAQDGRRMVEMHFIEWVYYSRETPEFDYLEWGKPKFQNEFMNHLYNKRVDSTRMGVGVPLSAKTITAIAQKINLFFKFLREQSNGELQINVFDPSNLNPARLKNHEVMRSSKISTITLRVDEQYITEDTFKLIYENASDDIKSAIALSYRYGLRRSEVLALETEDLKVDCLHSRVQLIAVKNERMKAFNVKPLSKVTGPLKNRCLEGRFIPHWYSTEEDTYQNLLNLSVIHPSTLSSKWKELMGKLGLSFTFHNLRNAFCSNALRDLAKHNISVVDVQLAMGHSDIKTTMKYLRDYRVMNKQVWTPKK